MHCCTLVQRFEPLLARGGFQLFRADQFFLQALEADFAIVDQHVGAALHDLIELFMVVQKAHDQVIHDQQGSGADDSRR